MEVCVLTYMYTTSIGWMAMKFVDSHGLQRKKPLNISKDAFSQPLWSLDLSSCNIGKLTVFACHSLEFGTNIHGSQRMSYINFEPLAFHSQPWVIHDQMNTCKISDSHQLQCVQHLGDISMQKG